MPYRIVSKHNWYGDCNDSSFFLHVTIIGRFGFVLYYVFIEREQRIVIIVPMFDQAQENGNTDRYIQFHLTPKMWLSITIVAATHNLNDDFVYQYWEDQSS